MKATTYNFRIAASTDAYHAGRRVMAGEPLKYEGNTIVKMIQVLCDSIEQGREILRQWAILSGAIYYNNESRDPNEHTEEKWYDGAGWYDPVSHEILYREGSDYYHDDVMTFEIEENTIPTDIYEMKVHRAQNLTELMAVMDDAEKFCDLDCMDFIKLYIVTHEGAQACSAGILTDEIGDFACFVSEGEETLCYSEQRGWFIKDTI